MFSCEKFQDTRILKLGKALSLKSMIFSCNNLGKAFVKAK